MKKTGIIIAIIVGVILIWGIGTYNGFVKKQEAMTTAWGQVENVYQRRADLVPNLVALVKNYSEYEQGTILAVTEARAKAAKAAVNTENFDENEFANFETVLDKTRKHMQSVEKDLDDLVGVRTRQINRKLSRVEMLESPDSTKLLEED